MWLFAGTLLGIALTLLVLWLRRKGIRIRWYEWLLGIVGMALLLFSLQNSLASAREFEPSAPGLFLLFFGLPALVLLILAAGLPWLRLAKPRLALLARHKPAEARAAVFKASQADKGR